MKTRYLFGKRFLLFILVLSSGISSNLLGQVAVFPGEAPIALVTQRTGDFGPQFNASGGFSCNFNRARGIISVGAEVQSDVYNSWDGFTVHVYYNGEWLPVFKTVNLMRWHTFSGNVPGESNVTQNGASTTNLISGINTLQHPTDYAIPFAWGGSPLDYRNVHQGHTFGFSDAEYNIYLKNENNLKLYDFSYEPLTDTVSIRYHDSVTTKWTIQFDDYTTDQRFPVTNGSDPASNIASGYDVGNVSIGGNVKGIYLDQYTPDITCIIFNMSNLPPEMLSSSSFKVRIYAHGSGDVGSRIYVTTYNNENPLKNPPTGLTASSNNCFGTVLNWSNSSNSLPSEAPMTLKNVILRDGEYVGMVDANATTFTDSTAAQNVVYNYTVIHVAFTETGKTYYKSNPSNVAEGQRKPTPEIAVSPHATQDRCNSEVELTWEFNTANPEYFRIERATALAGPYTILDTLAGTERLFLDTNVTRGVKYFYKIYSISDCGVLSLGAATIIGFSPDDPEVATNVVANYNGATGFVDVSWDDNSGLESGYQLIRQDDLGNTVYFDLNPNDTTYTDDGASTCRIYNYKVKVLSACVPGGLISSSQDTALVPPPGLANTFDATHFITGSKGYFSNRVELAWSLNNANKLDLVKIYRKILGTADSVLITAQNPSTGLYIDNTTDARVLYEYTIVGERNCNGDVLLSNISTDVGFRNPMGTISGHIEFTGGVAVEDARVVAEATSGDFGNALIFTGGSAVAQDRPQIEANAELRMEFWVNPTNTTAGNLISKSGAYSVTQTGSAYDVSITTTTGTYTVSLPNATVGAGNWNGISIQYDGTTLAAYANGAIVTSVPATGTIIDSPNNVVIGGSAHHFKFDELRILDIAIDSATAVREYSRYKNGNEVGFKLYLHCDEGVGRGAYDVSKVSNIYNANHFALSGSYAWTSDRPSSAEIAYKAYTDALGNYVIPGIRYNGFGDNYTIIPSKGVHSFSPSSRSVYLGDLSQVFTNQDFEDISSFQVTGVVKYGVPFGDTLSCFVPDVALKIDGQPVIRYGNVVRTDANGFFDIQVPIGIHTIGVEKFQHSFSDSVTVAMDFQEPVSGLVFVDTTTRLVVGRVVGGLIEANKAPGMGRSSNNIGVAKVRFATPIAGATCYSSEVLTDPSTGEYAVKLPPMQYKVDTVFVVNSGVTPAINPSNLTNGNATINLTNFLPPTTEIDTLYDETTGGVLSIDSITYSKELNFIHRTAPLVNVTDVTGQKFIGENTLVYEGVTIPIPATPTTWGPFGWPVFQQGNSYACDIHAHEEYLNYDSGAIDTVLLNGSVTITNDIVNGADPNANLDLVGGVANYSFVAGDPNNSTGSQPEFDYTKTIQFTVVPQGAAATSWQPNGGTYPSNPEYRAYVLGSKITGTGVATLGPERVDFILRDPAGSGSSATWTSGHSTTTSSEFSVNVGAEASVSASVSAGFEQSVGFGVMIPVEVGVEAGVGLSVSASAGYGGFYSETVTTTSSVSTRDDEDHVGAAGDVFIGRSRNWLVGPTSNIELIDAGQCTASSVCFGPTVSGKRFAKKLGYAVQPSDVKTRFSYTQDEIENVVIPTLESLRSVKLGTSLYTSALPDTDPRYGANNDDPIFGASATSTTPFKYESVDRSGPSYTFSGATLESDSVRIINQQIALWKQALARNEREKWEAVNNTGGSTLIDNFTLGSAIVTNSYEVNTESGYQIDWELSLTEEVNLGFTAEAGGVGVSLETSLSLTETVGGGLGASSSNVTAFEYTLTDGDPGDIFSIDVYTAATGNIFVTRGGRSMCPYEDAVQPHYFDPLNPNAAITSHSFIASPTATIQLATVQREMPDIAITPASQTNIPSDQEAVYQLVLTNQSPEVVDNDIDMRIRVASESNPNGAIVRIDGLDPNTLYTIPAGASIIKTLTVERGPIHTDYDSLMIIFSSACSEDIADTAYISVQFIPTCTELDIVSPNDNWILNANNQDMLNIGISDYNYNYGAATIIDTLPDPDDTIYLGLNRIGFEMKPSSSSSWVQIEEFLKYPGPTDSIIPTGSTTINYLWDVSQIPDGLYEIRAKSYCLNYDGSISTITSPVYAGVMDRITPKPFGTPSPADGILAPEDDISIQFNEPLEIGYLSSDNFQVRGILNGSDLRHSEFLNFDGIDDYVEIPGGVGLQNKSFSVEFWTRQLVGGTDQVIISQGVDPSESIAIGFDASGKLKANINGSVILSNLAVSGLTNWNHYAVVYNYEIGELYLYQNGTLLNPGSVSLSVNYGGIGKLVVGKQIPSNTNFYQGHLHELRVWNRVRTAGELTEDMNIVLGSDASGLVHNWQIDEARGIIIKDKIRQRNGVLYGANWQVDPNGFACVFDGVDDYLTIDAATVPITENMDATLEFWFNSTTTSAATLFSSGLGDGIGGDSLTGWEINKDASGYIHVLHHGIDFQATDSNYFDGGWHHFALVLNKNANLTSFVDGVQQNSIPSTGFGALSGTYYTLGARGYIVSGGAYIQDNYFQGMIDEYRLWNASRKTEQLQRDLNNRMKGDEYALLVHLPFETYTTSMGVPVLSASIFNNAIEWTSATVSSFGGAATINQTPVIKLPRPVQDVNFTWLLNTDKIVITPTTSPELLEHQTIDITVQNVYDLRSNKMESPKTWIAYFNKNQVYWEQDVLEFEIQVDDELTFTGTILNTGGSIKAFEISGLPDWLSADITSGTIAPNSSLDVQFTVQDGLNVGEYYGDIALTTDFNYNEILRIGLKINGTPPDWTIDPTDFQYSMSIIGEIELEGVINGNPETMIAGFMNDTIVALGNLEYIEAYDRYEVFLSAYSNYQIGDSIHFQVYDANTGNLYPIVTPTIYFTDGEVLGTISTPITFQASMVLVREIPLNDGWTWISLPLSSADQGNSNALFEGLIFQDGDVSKGQTMYDQYDPTSGWIGSISMNGGYENVLSYRVHKTVADTLILLGTRIHPDSSYAEINVVPGWNWIGFMSTKNIPLAEALGNYNAQDGDLIKSQYAFAIYDGISGTWNGSLTTMRPGLGYNLKTSVASSFHYPLSTYLRTGEVEMITPYYPLNVGAYSKTMNVIAVTNMCDEILSESTTVLGAFDAAGNLRGFATPQPTMDGDRLVFYVTLYGNEENEELEFTFFHNETGQKLASETRINIVDNGLEGSLYEPFEVHLNDENACSNFTATLITLNESNISLDPNPFNTFFEVKLNEAFTGTIQIVDLSGRTIERKDVQNVTNYIWNQNDHKRSIIDGVYFIQLINQQGEIQQFKMVKSSLIK